VGAFLGATVALSQVVERRRAARDPEARRNRTYALLVRPGSVLVGMAVLAAVSVLLLVQLGEDEARPSPTAVRLLRDLVSEEAKGCDEVTPAPRAIAALSCQLDAPMDSLRISLFTSTEDLRRTMSQKVRDTGVVEGDCSTQRFAWDQWSRGRVICDYGDADVTAELVWSRQDSQVLLEAVARPGADAYAVYRWWTEESNGQPTNNSLPYPNRFEEYMLERTGLRGNSCKRGGVYKSSKAAVRCEVGPSGDLALYYYDSLAKLKRSFFVTPGRDGSCTTDRHSPGRSRYSVDGTRPAGVRHCYSSEDDDTSTIEWINWSSRFYGFVRVDAYGELHGLYEWWEKRGRYLTD
jgi:hypothetical protein